MNWDALGAMGEIIGAIAVLATLYYLSNQIKINSEQVEKANDYQSSGKILAYTQTQIILTDWFE